VGSNVFCSPVCSFAYIHLIFQFLPHQTKNTHSRGIHCALIFLLLKIGFHPRTLFLEVVQLWCTWLLYTNWGGNCSEPPVQIRLAGINAFNFYKQFLGVLELQVFPQAQDNLTVYKLNGIALYYTKTLRGSLNRFSGWFIEIRGSRPWPLRSPVLTYGNN